MSHLVNFKNTFWISSWKGQNRSVKWNCQSNIQVQMTTRLENLTFYERMPFWCQYGQIWLSIRTLSWEDMTKEIWIQDNRKEHAIYDIFDLCDSPYQKGYLPFWDVHYEPRSVWSISRKFWQLWFLKNMYSSKLKVCIFSLSCKSTSHC